MLGNDEIVIQKRQANAEHSTVSEPSSLLVEMLSAEGAALVAPCFVTAILSYDHLPR
jgi:hypothetical protein